MKTSVLYLDLADNAVGRAILLAPLLERLGQAEIVGPCSESEIWEPARSERVPHRTLPATKFPRFAASIRALSRLADGDLLDASKPLLLDIDDWEVLGVEVDPGASMTVGSRP